MAGSIFSSGVVSGRRLTEDSFPTACSPRSGSECLNRDDPKNPVLAGRAQRQVRHLLQRRGVRRFYGSLCLGSRGGRGKGRPFTPCPLCLRHLSVHCIRVFRVRPRAYAYVMYISTRPPSPHPSLTHTKWNASGQLQWFINHGDARSLDLTDHTLNHSLPAHCLPCPFLNASNATCTLAQRCERAHARSADTRALTFTRPTHR
jgi:hypothetical protein